MLARSTVEAEYRSLTMIICEVLWVKQLLKELGLKHLGSTPIFCDNQAALAIAGNLVHREKTEHVGIDWYFIKEKTPEGQVTPIYVPTSQQPADALTKVLSIE